MLDNQPGSLQATHVIRILVPIPDLFTEISRAVPTGAETGTASRYGRHTRIKLGSIKKDILKHILHTSLSAGLIPCMNIASSPGLQVAANMTPRKKVVRSSSRKEGELRKGCG